MWLIVVEARVQWDGSWSSLSLSVGLAAACAAGSCLLVDSLRFRWRGGLQMHR